MNLEEAIEILDHYRKLPALNQNLNKNTILKAFRTLWNCEPTEELFAEHTNGINLQPEMLYMMVKP